MGGGFRFEHIGYGTLYISIIYIEYDIDIDMYVVCSIMHLTLRLI